MRDHKEPYPLKELEQQATLYDHYLRDTRGATKHVKLLDPHVTALFHHFYNLGREHATEGW